MAKIYRGKRLKDGVEVSVLVIDVRQRKRVRALRRIPFHSPDGFAWGTTVPARRTWHPRFWLRISGNGRLAQGGWRARSFPAGQ
jgi:hypothetical protein